MGDMEMRSADKIELEKGDEDSRSYHAPNVPSNWQFSGSNLIASSMGLISAENPIAIHRGDVVESSSCSTASMVDSFCPTIWDQPTTNSQNMFSDLNVQNNASSSSTLGFRKGNLGPPRTDLERALDMGWTPETSMLKQTMLLPTSSRMIPQSLSQFPTDTGFIERAARFSCFSGGNYTDMVNPFSIPESMSPYSRGATPMQGPQKVDDRLNSVTGGQSRKNEMSMVECSNDNPMPIEHEGNRGPPLNHVRNSESFLRSHDQANQDLYEPSNDSDEAELVTGGAQAEPSAMDGTGGGTPAKTHGLKKRKRPGQDAELQQATGASNPPEIAEDDSGIPLKQDHNATSTINKPGGKHGKHVSQASDSNKEDYIHVRARRGQATNSHSLAERVRREKISERMKYLQDLVPGCSKVTGKAVMLDEIINYVQSLQRQVEFLSMKLATVNPRPDFNIEGLLAKDILQSRAGPSSAIGFHPDMRMPYAPMHLSQHGLIQSGLAGMGASPDALRRTITSHLTAVGGGYKEPNSQVPNVWEDELHNIVQMGLNSNITLDEEDLVGPTSHPKAEL